MTEFVVNLAGVPIGIKALFQNSFEFCQDYLTDEKPIFTINMTEEDLLSERVLNERQMAHEGYSQADFSDAYMETLALYRKITAKLLFFNIILVHGTVLACGGKAYLFTAKSGIGKTTHANLWLKYIPDCHILNGDKPLVLFKDNKIYACGTPWQGKEAYGKNEILPLDGICILNRGKKNHIQSISFAQAYPILLKQTHIPEGSEQTMAVIRLLAKLNGINFFQLSCNMESEAAMIAYKKMVLEEKS